MALEVLVEKRRNVLDDRGFVIQTMPICEEWVPLNTPMDTDTGGGTVYCSLPTVRVMALNHLVIRKAK